MYWVVFMAFSQRANRYDKCGSVGLGTLEASIVVAKCRVSSQYFRLLAVGVDLMVSGLPRANLSVSTLRAGRRMA